MRLTQVVRIGGRLALLMGFVLLNLVSGNSLTYFYGYSTPGLASWQSTDSLGGQSVSFVPQVSMVTQSTGNVGLAFGAAAAYTDNVYSSFGDVQAASSGMGAGFAGWQPVAMGTYAAPAAASSSSGGGGGVYMGGYSPTYVNVNGSSSWNAWFSPSQQQPATLSSDAWAWQSVRDSTVPAVTGNFGSPTVNTPTIIIPASFYYSGTNPRFSALDGPEPATFGIMVAGLAGLFLLRRRLS